MTSYIDERNGLPAAVVGPVGGTLGRACVHRRSVWGGLDAARSFADLFGDTAAYNRYRDAAERLREASTRTVQRELGAFLAGSQSRTTSRSPSPRCWTAPLRLAVGMYAPRTAIVDTMHAIADQLSNKAAVEASRATQILLLQGGVRHSQGSRQPVVQVARCGWAVVRRDARRWRTLSQLRT